MSLRARILLLFVSFAVLPVILLGIGDHVQSVAALRAVLEARTEALAEQVAREVESAHGRAVALLAESPRRGEAGADDPILLTAAADGGTPAADAYTCWEHASAALRVSGGATARSGADPGGLIAAETLVTWAPALLGRVGKTGYVQVLHRRTGALMLDSRCWARPIEWGVSLAGGPLDVPGPVRDAVVGSGANGSVRATMHYGASRDMVVSVASAGPDWAVAVHTSTAEFVAPFREARSLYLGLALLMILASVGAALVLLQGSLRSLQLVTAAADEIELGNLRPWLPPPGRDEVGRLSLAFRRMTERLDSSIRRAELSQKMAAVGELATYLSHEIRNPLSSIRLGVQSLHRDLKGGYIPADATRMVELTLREVNRLDGVVRAVLEMGRPAAAGVPRVFPVHAALEEALEVLRPRLRARGVELAYIPHATPDLAVGDADGLRGVVMNLVLNALDALEGRDDGRIRVSTWTVRDEELLVRVVDNGAGVPGELVDALFEPFFTTKASGNGIGLPVALRTVQAWGGTIVHEPVAAGSGAVFVVKLKLAGKSATEPAPEPEPTTAGF